ncbi:hypothetical protein [Alkalilimnicola sp. S0819]|uniref:hypothetical protein n=1 Tax=Alkalilimnicola sp. S0819 TaxID=2613922 RepID=UPI0012627687|nr:hypothetical protein [Alkalilimnicola sp. S0819]KAB7623015.1 hypothetical protein F3N43_10815 [Alkalilimnicola sp. S0819]MPQ17127.1 hypothetical protein [Alkalilimnicola sp. S0819]
MSEVERLKAENEQLRQRLEEEGLYFRGELEASRRLLQEQNTLLQAAEVAKRRRAEEELAALKGQLREARERAEANERRCAELERALQAQAEDLRREAAAEQERLRQSVQAAWQDAEEETQRLERELSRNRLALAEEMEQRRELERRLRDGGGGEDAALKMLLRAQKRALRQVDAARRAAELELAELKAGAPAPRFGGGLSGAFGNARSADPAPQRPALQKAKDNELNQDGAWAKVTLGEMDEEFNEEFLMMGADESMGEVQRLEAAVVDRSERSEPEPAPEALEKTALSVQRPQPRKPAHTPSAESPAAAERVDRSRFQSPEPESAAAANAWLWPVLGAAGLLGAGVLGWLLI